MMTYHPERIHKVIIKLSGEILSGGKGFGYDLDTVNNLIDELIDLKKLGYSVGIVIGGGNLFRGSIGEAAGISRVVGDNIGMLATVQNALLLADCMNKRNYVAEVYSSIQIEKFSKFYTPARGLRSLDEGKTCFFCAGTGNPYFTTDSAAVLRALELNADLIIKGTKVDGIYTADPEKNINAELIKSISFDEVLARKLNVMDMTAFSLARDNNMPIKIININKPGMLKLAISEKETGSFIHP